MSATDELRRVLDERGVAHSDNYFSTTWRGARGILHLANESMAGGSLVVDMLTPEQAIAATLGGGTLTAEQVREAIFGNSSYVSYDGAKYYADGIGMQAIADELNTRAERARRNVADEWERRAGIKTSFCCSECGAHYEDCDSYFAGLADADSNWIRTNYCPNCGARVEA